MEQISARSIDKNFNQEQRLYDDTTTWLAEVLDGNMRSSFEFNFDGKELYARDGSGVRAVFESALTESGKITEAQPNLVFEWRRRTIELEEYKAMLAVAAGELPNTMVVISDFPPELMDAKTSVGGYNTERKQTMLRVISRSTNGNIKLTSQSLDQSDRTALEAIYQTLGFDAQPGELLGQRMHLDLSHEEQDLLIDKLMGVYDRTLAGRYGEQFYAGRRDNPFNTYIFVQSQGDLLNEFMIEHEGYRREDLLYGLAAAMEARYESITQLKPSIALSSYTPLAEMFIAANKARAEGKTYTGCGLSLNGAGTTAQTELTDSGYGNQTNEASIYKFDKKMHCVVCQAPPKAKEAKKLCGPCGICKSCDTKLRRQ